MAGAQRDTLAGFGVSVAATRGMLLAAALLVLTAAWIWPLAGLAHDLFFVHMAQHVLAMSVAAILAAIAMRSHDGLLQVPLTVAAVAQMGGLWLWHMPAVFTATHHNIALDMLMKVSLFVAAVAFWRAILRTGRRSAWPPILALMITAKLFCLLGAAFVFSRRALYPHIGNPERWGFTALEDQHLAGLLMVSSCALIYVAAAIALFAAWLFRTGDLPSAKIRPDAAQAAR
jgi:putative membrane protein